MDKWDRKTNFNCASCMFFVPKWQPESYVNCCGEIVKNVEPQKGRCRRRAPKLGGYPVVYATDWCGEHKIGSNPVRDGKVAKEDVRKVMDESLDSPAFDQSLIGYEPEVKKSSRKP